MNEYDPSELVGVCEAILEDGELSGEEIYRLAEWLNDHREACLHWPGELLVGPLQEVWADGKVTKTEMRQIGKVLVRIRKEWAKRQADAAFQQAADFANQIAATIDLSQPFLPLIPYVMRVKSHTDRSVLYDVDLSGPLCTCPDWRSNRRKLAPGHLTRCCKHVFDAYDRIEPEAGWPGWLGAFFDLAWSPHPRHEWMVFCAGRELVLASTAPTGWANVFAHEGTTYDRFGYNVFEDRWSYGIEPSQASHIRETILTATNR